VLSVEPETKTEFGNSSKPQTQSVCPSRVSSRIAVKIFQIFIVSSREEVTSLFEDFSKRRFSMGPSCPQKRRIALNFVVS